MNLSRFEVNIETGVAVEIAQTVYVNALGVVLVIDSSMPAPDGFAVAVELPAAPAAVPEVVTMRQARLALHASGRLADIESAIAALPDPQRTAASIAWNYSSEVVRGDSFVEMLGGLISLTNADIDALFIAAADM